MALDRTPGSALTSASMKHSHSVSGATVRTPIHKACDLPTQRGGNGGLWIRRSAGGAPQARGRWRRSRPRSGHRLPVRAGGLPDNPGRAAIAGRARCLLPRRARTITVRCGACSPHDGGAATSRGSSPRCLTARKMSHATIASHTAEIASSMTLHRSLSAADCAQRRRVRRRPPPPARNQRLPTSPYRRRHGRQSLGRRQAA